MTQYKIKMPEFIVKLNSGNAIHNLTDNEIYNSDAQILNDKPAFRAAISKNEAASLVAKKYKLTIIQKIQHKTIFFLHNDSEKITLSKCHSFKTEHLYENYLPPLLSSL